MILAEKVINNKVVELIKLYNFYFGHFFIRESGSNIVHKIYLSLLLFMKPYERYVKFVNNFTITFSYEEITKIKVVHLDELYNFHVHDFLRWNHLVFQNIVWICHFLKFKIWISKNGNLKQHFQRVNDFSWKSQQQQQSCRTHQDLQLLFWKTSHVTLFVQFKIWISKNGKFKQDFQTPNHVRWKSHEHKSCISQQDLHRLFWKTFDVTLFEAFKIWI